KQARVREPLALFGVSYGAVAAIHTAADPEVGIDALIAMEPFTNAGDAIRRMGGFAKEGGSGSWRKRFAAWWARMKISSDDFERALDRASQSIGTDLRTHDTAPFLARVSVCTLLIQGGADTLVDVSKVRAMARANPTRVVYAEAPKEGHLTLPARFGWLGKPVANWLDAALATRKTAPSTSDEHKSCPPLSASPDPRRRQSLLVAP
ncbi:MAG: alpha/beta fold hydrolase, partial [Lysobacterales bacterium]